MHGGGDSIGFGMNKGKLSIITNDPSVGITSRSGKEGKELEIIKKKSSRRLTVISTKADINSPLKLSG